LTKATPPPLSWLLIDRDRDVERFLLRGKNQVDSNCKSSAYYFFVMPNVQVILKEPIRNLGSEADVVSVRAGFARNFLVPQGKALEATKYNLRHIQALKAARAEREAKEIAEAEAFAAKLKKITVKLTLRTGQDGKAFGSISATQIQKALEEQKITLEKHAVQLEKAIKQTGTFDVPVRIHPQVSATVKVKVSAEKDGETEETAAE
jgi:large subunit ribosomal protein L9